jgi:hypothetical protein
MQLSLPEQMAGQNVRCYGCATIFIAKLPDAIPVLEEVNPLDFTEEDTLQTPKQRRRVRALIEPAVFWLRFSGILFFVQVVLMGIGSLLQMGTGNMQGMVITWVGMFMVGSMTGFIWKAIYNLQMFRGQGGIIATAVAAIVLALLRLVLVMLVLTQVGRLNHEDQGVIMLLSMLDLGSGIIHLIAGIRTIMIVNTPEVADAFR